MIETRESYPSFVDFDESHREWTRNKRKLPNGMYRYICSGIFRNGNPCNRFRMPFRSTCRIHEGDEDSIHTHTETDNIREVSVVKPAVRISPVMLSELDIEEAKDNNTDAPQSPPAAAWSPLRKFACLFWKSRKTTPTTALTNLEEETNMYSENEIVMRVPTIDIRKESICIYTTPPIYGTFTQIRNATKLYRCIDVVDTPEKIRNKRRDISVVVYNLQLMLSFLEGLEEMTKLEAKQPNIVDMKAHLLAFFGYDVATHINTTRKQWAKTSEDIRTEIATIMGILFQGMEQ